MKILNKQDLLTRYFIKACEEYASINRKVESITYENRRIFVVYRKYNLGICLDFIACFHIKVRRYKQYIKNKDSSGEITRFVPPADTYVLHFHGNGNKLKLPFKKIVSYNFKKEELFELLDMIIYE